MHGIDEYNKAIETTEKLFANTNAPAEDLSEDDLNNMEGIVKIDYAADKINTGVDIVSFLAETNIFPSKGEARKMVQGGGVSINRNKIDGTEFIVETSLLLYNRYLLIQKGRRNYYLIKAV